MSECKHFIRHYDCDGCTVVSEKMRRGGYLRTCGCGGNTECCDFDTAECERIMTQTAVKSIAERKEQKCPKKNSKK